MMHGGWEATQLWNFSCRKYPICHGWHDYAQVRGTHGGPETSTYARRHGVFSCSASRARGWREGSAANLRGHSWSMPVRTGVRWLHFLGVHRQIQLVLMASDSWPLKDGMSTMSESFYFTLVSHAYHGELDLDAACSIKPLVGGIRCDIVQIVRCGLQHHPPGKGCRLVGCIVVRLLLATVWCSALCPRTKCAPRG